MKAALNRVAAGCRRAALVGGVLVAVAAFGRPVAAQVEPAGPANDAAPATLLEAELQAETTRAGQALERVRQQLAGLSSPAWAEDVQQAVERAAGLRVRLASSQVRSEEIDRLYDASSDEIVMARTELRAALDTMGREGPARPFETRLDLDALRATTVGQKVGALEGLLADIDRETEALNEAAREDRWRRVLAWRTVVLRLNGLRIDMLGRLTPRYRAEVLGLSRTGIAQLKREAGHLALSARVYALERLHGWRETRLGVRDVFTVGRVAWTLLKIALVLAAFGLLWNRGPALLRWSERAARDPRRGARARRRLRLLVAAGRVVAPWLLLLLLFEALSRAAGPAAAWPEVRLLHRLATLYVLYRLSIEVLVGASLALVRRYRLQAGATRARKVLRSARVVLRVVFAVIVLLTLSSRFLGQGYLYHVVVRIALVAVAVTLLGVFLRWREDILEAYLSRAGGGRLRQTVERSRHRWYGAFLAAGALLVLAGRALVTLTGEFALGFDQTRRGLAFLFRRRVEKQAERTGYADLEPGRSLPAPLLEALTEDPVTDPRLLVDHFPGMDRLQEALAAWRAENVGGSFLLTGDLGIGRTSWLEHIEVDGLPVQRVTFDRRIGSDALLAGQLGAGMGLEDPGTLKALRHKLLELPPRVVVVDRGQNLFLARVGGYAGFEAFVSLLEDTMDRVFWIVAFSQRAWEHIAAVHPQLAGFRHQVTLEPWSEERVRELIRKRVEACGVPVNYDDMVLESLEGLPRHVRDAEIEEGYARLLWNHTQGLPRVALHYWGRSLVPDAGNGVRVRLFRTPQAEELERGADVPLFLLAAIVVHESLTLTEMELVTRYPKQLCRIHVQRLLDLGAIRRTRRRYWVTPYWHPVVSRTLKRHNLLAD